MFLSIWLLGLIFSKIDLYNLLKSSLYSNPSPTNELLEDNILFSLLIDNKELIDRSCIFSILNSPSELLICEIILLSKSHNGAFHNSESKKLSARICSSLSTFLYVKDQS